MEPAAKPYLGRPAGVVLPAVLLVIALLATGTLCLVGEVQRIVTIYTSQIHTGQADALAVARLFTLYPPEPSAMPDRPLVLSATSEMGKHTATRSLYFSAIKAGAEILNQRIVDGSVLTAEEFPHFDYEALFQNFDYCDAVRVSSSTHSPFGFRLTSSAVFSAALCQQIPGLSIDRMVYQANFATDQELQLHGLLAATGYVDLAGRIQANGDLTVIAAGDLHIAEIQASPFSVTLISATGAVIIDRISGTQPLQVVGRRGVYLAPIDGPAAMKPLPEMLSVNALGFTG